MSNDDKNPPWTPADKRRRTHHVLLRLTEEQKLQLDYIASHTSVRSAHDWILRRLVPLLNEEATTCWETDLLCAAVSKAVRNAAENQRVLQNPLADE